MTSQKSSTARAATRQITTAARLIAILAVLATALVACSAGSRNLSGSPGSPGSPGSAGSPGHPVASAKASAAKSAAAPKPVAWDRELPATGYPGAAALVSKAAASVPAETILPPASNPHSDTPQYWLDNCLDAPDAATEKVCVFGDTKNPVLTVAMVGGSTDGNWFPALEQIALQRHWKLVTDLHGTCEWTDAMLVVAATGAKYTACYAWGQATLKDLETKIKPDVVVAGGYPEDGTVGDPVPGSAGSIATIATGMATYWTDLENHGISVVAMRETPVPDFSLADCVVKYGRTSAKCMVPTAKAIIADSPVVLAAKDARRQGRRRQGRRRQGRRRQGAGRRHEPVHLRANGVRAGRRQHPCLPRRAPPDRELLQEHDQVPRAAPPAGGAAAGQVARRVSDRLSEETGIGAYGTPMLPGMERARCPLRDARCPSILALDL